MCSILFPLHCLGFVQQYIFAVIKGPHTNTFIAQLSRKQDLQMPFVLYVEELMGFLNDFDF